MKYCTRCGAEIVDEAVVCPKCGCAVGQIVAGGSGIGQRFVVGLVMLVLGVVGLIVSLIMMYSAEGQLRWKLDDSYPVVMVGFLVVSCIVAFIGVILLLTKKNKLPEKQNISTVAKKSHISFGISVLSTLIVGVAGIICLTVLNKDYADTFEKHDKPLGDAAHILEALHSLRAEVRNAVILTGKKEELQKTEVNINKLHKDYNDAVASFSKFIVNPENKERLADAKEAFEKGFILSVNDILYRAKIGESSESLMTLLQATATPQAAFVSEKMDQVIESKQKNLDDVQDDGSKTTKILIVTMIIIMVIGIVVPGIVHLII